MTVGAVGFACTRRCYHNICTEMESGGKQRKRKRQRKEKHNITNVGHANSEMKHYEATVTSVEPVLSCSWDPEPGEIPACGDVAEAAITAV